MFAETNKTKDTIIMYLLHICFILLRKLKKYENVDKNCENDLINIKRSLLDVKSSTTISPTTLTSPPPTSPPLTSPPLTSPTTVIPPFTHHCVPALLPFKPPT